MEIAKLQFDINRADPDRMAKAIEELSTSRYSVVVCRQEKDSAPCAVMMHPSMFELLVKAYDDYSHLVASPEYAKLKLEVSQLQKRVAALIEQIRAMRKDDEEMDMGAWKKLRASLFDEVD